MGTHFCQVLLKAQGCDTTEHTSVHTADPAGSIFMFKSLCLPPCFLKLCLACPSCLFLSVHFITVAEGQEASP